MERALRATQRLADQDFAAVIIIAAQLTTHHIRRNDADPQMTIRSRMPDHTFQKLF